MSTEKNQEQLQDRKLFECKLRNYVYDFVALRDNMRSHSIYLTIPDLREISDKAAKAAGRALARIHTRKNTT